MVLPFPARQLHPAGLSRGWGGGGSKSLTGSLFALLLYVLLVCVCVCMCVHAQTHLILGERAGPRLCHAPAAWPMAQGLRVEGLCLLEQPWTCCEPGAWQPCWPPLTPCRRASGSRERARPAVGADRPATPGEGVTGQWEAVGLGIGPLGPSLRRPLGSPAPSPVPVHAGRAPRPRQIHAFLSGTSHSAEGPKAALPRPSPCMPRGCLRLP